VSATRSPSEMATNQTLRPWLGDRATTGASGTIHRELEDGRYLQLIRRPQPASEANDSTGLSPSTGDRCHAEIEMSTVGGCASE
jgi:hypothetical protein